MTERKTETPSKGILKCTLNLLICYFYILSGITGIIGIIGKIGISGIIGIIIPDRYKSFLPPIPIYYLNFLTYQFTAQMALLKEPGPPLI